MTKYEVALKILPFLINSDYSTNAHQMARRAFEIAEAFDEVSLEFPEIGMIDLGLTDEFPHWDETMMSVMSGIEVPEISTEPWNNFEANTDTIKFDFSTEPTFEVNGNVDISQVNISFK